MGLDRNEWHFLSFISTQLSASRAPSGPHTTLLAHGGPSCLSFMHSDFHLFGPINRLLADYQFAREANIKQAFVSSLHIVDISFFCAFVKASVLQWDICIDIPMGLRGGLICTICSPCTVDTSKSQLSSGHHIVPYLIFLNTFVCLL
jgi:hypothetical protein